MRMRYMSNDEKVLQNKLTALVKEHGFTMVLDMMEELASDNADYSKGPWETVRQNLENSVLEMEEWNISGDIN